MKKKLKNIFIRDVILHETVELIATGEKAIIVWMDEENIDNDSFLLEVKGKDADFLGSYQRNEFKKIND